MFLVGFPVWNWDAFDFFTVSLTITKIVKEFNVANSKVSPVGLSTNQLLDDITNVRSILRGS